MILVLVVMSFFDVLSATSEPWEVTAVLTLGIGVMFVLGRGFVARAAPAQMQPVVDAVRDAPETIVSVRCFLAGVGPTTRYLEIKTASHCLMMVAHDDLWIYRGLQRLCPRASFEDQLAALP